MGNSKQRNKRSKPRKLEPKRNIVTVDLHPILREMLKREAKKMGFGGQSRLIKAGLFHMLRKKQPILAKKYQAMMAG